VEDGNLVRVIMDLIDSLERQFERLERRLERKMDDGLLSIANRLDKQAAGLDQHAGLWRAGTMWSSRMDAWVEKIDGVLDAKDREIAELRERLARMERRLDGGSQS
jgi:hypothetical protein